MGTIKHRLDPWDLPDSGDSYAEHVRFVESAKKRTKILHNRRRPGRPKGSKNKKRVKRATKQKPPVLSPEEIARRVILAGYTERELRAELLRRRLAARTPEEVVAQKKTAAEARARARALCKHDKLPPKMKKFAPPAPKYAPFEPPKRKWYCPSCFAPVPSPTKEPEKMVIVI